MWQTPGEGRVLVDVAQVQLAAAARDLDVLVVCDLVHQTGNAGRAERVRDLLPHRRDEGLLAREAEEVRVGVAEADEVERLLAAQVLVARLEVDVRVVRRGRAGVLVVVAPVDVDPDAAELVHDADEPEKVDADQVVDRQVRQVPHGLERAREAAGGVGAVDAAGAVRHGCTAVLAGAVDRHE
jgi:hypothetical protein